MAAGSAESPGTVVAWATGGHLDPKSGRAAAVVTAAAPLLLLESGDARTGAGKG